MLSFFEKNSDLCFSFQQISKWWGGSAPGDPFEKDNNFHKNCHDWHEFIMSAVQSSATVEAKGWQNLCEFGEFDTLDDISFETDLPIMMRNEEQARKEMESKK